MKLFKIIYFLFYYYLSDLDLIWFDCTKNFYPSLTRFFREFV